MSLTRGEPARARKNLAIELGPCAQPVNPCVRGRTQVIRYVLDANDGEPVRGRTVLDQGPVDNTGGEPARARESPNRLRWPASSRNDGRNQIETVAEIKSEFLAKLPRNSHISTKRQRVAGHIKGLRTE